MAKYGAATNGAASGFAMGMQTGNPYVAIAAAVVGGVMGAKESREQDKQLAAEIKARNMKMLQMNGETFFEIQRQLAANIENTESALDYIERTSGRQKADISVQNAMADAIGASAQIAMADAEQKKQEADAKVMRDLDYAADSSTVAVFSMLNQSATQWGDYAKYTQSLDKSEEQMAEGIMNFGMTMGSAWSEGKFKDMGTKRSPDSSLETSTARGRSNKSNVPKSNYSFLGLG
jgi:hypothetical protein